VTDEARLDAVVHGRVHGVGFRVFVRRAARGLGLRGWVANESSNRVRFVAEGPRADLERLLAAAQAGPPAAYVERVDATWPQPTGTLAGFEVRPGSHSGD
jgi:acylphosphatase